MYDLYYFPTPNGHKVTLFLEELELPYTIKVVDITKGDQFEPDFLKISPNNRMPALVDQQPKDGQEPVTVFESGAILMYLAEKHGQFLPAAGPARYQVIQWLMWQMGGLGPMLGQNHHFNRYAPEPIPYAQERYNKETRRLYKVLEKQLEGQEFICGTYSIADMAAHPWCRSHEWHYIDLAEFPNVQAWVKRIRARPAADRAYAIEKQFERAKTLSDEARRNMFERDPD